MLTLLELFHRTLQAYQDLAEASMVVVVEAHLELSLQVLLRPWFASSPTILILASFAFPFVSDNAELWHEVCCVSGVAASPLVWIA